MSDILMVIGPCEALPRKTDLAAVGFGMEAARRTGAAVDLLLVGPESGAAAAEFARLGPRRVHTLDHPDLASYTAEAYAEALAEFVAERTYRLVGASASTTSRDFFPRVAASLDVPMASDVLAIDELTGDGAVFQRAVFAGNLLARVELCGPKVLATCRASAFEAAAASDTAAPIETVSMDRPLALTGKRFVSLERQASDRPDLTEAEVVVSGGRGTKGDEGIELLDRLADRLGAAVGCTRAVVDAGWLPNDLQVGQTGKIVAPELYIAVAISGAIQHLAGMRNSKTIVAINKDSESPIFEIADIGLVADMFQAVPKLVEALENT